MDKEIIELMQAYNTSYFPTLLIVRQRLDAGDLSEREAERHRQTVELYEASLRLAYANDIPILGARMRVGGGFDLISCMIKWLKCNAWG